MAAAVVAAVFMAEVGGPGGILHAPGSDYTDLLITHWPNAHLFRDSVLRDHCLPLWNPSMFSGTPFAANPLSGIWYPPNWIVLLLPITATLNLLLLAHLVLGAVGAGYLVRRLRTVPSGGWVGPLVSALAWGLTPRTWGSLGAGHVGVIYALGWLPWVVDAAVEQVRAGRSRLCVRLPALWALQFLADPRMAAYTAMLLAGLVGWHLVMSGRGLRRRKRRIDGGELGNKLIRWALIGILAIGLSAVLWVPMADFLPYTTRAGLTVKESGLYSLSLSQLVGLVWPNRGGFHEWTIYVGTGVIWLAVLGWLTCSKRLRWAIVLACCLLVTVALGANAPLYPLLAQLPGAGLLRVPPRVWHLVALCMAMLAGLGAAELAGVGGSLREQRHNVTRAAVIMIAYVGLLGAGMWSFAPSPSARAGAVWAFLWLVAAVVASQVALAGRLAGMRRAALVLVLIVSVDLIWVDTSLVERMQVEEAFAVDMEVSEQLAQLGGRVYAPSFRPSQHVVAAANLRIVNGVDPLHLTEYTQFLNTAAGLEGVGGYNVTVPPLSEHADPGMALAGRTPDLDLLSMLDVRGVVSEFDLSDPNLELVASGSGGSLKVYSSDVSIPWPVVFQRVEVVGDLDEALDAIRVGNTGERVVVRGGHALDGPTGYTPAALVSSTANRLLIEASGPGLLVASEVAHRGWRARVDGQEAEIYHANGVLRGVYLAEGEHIVEMTYRPAAVFWGLGVSIASLGLLLAAFWWSRRRG